MAATDSVFASKESGVTGAGQVEADHSELLQSDALKHDLVTMERVVNLNTYQPKQASYRGYEIIPGNNHTEYWQFFTYKFTFHLINCLLIAYTNFIYMTCRY